MTWMYGLHVAIIFIYLFGGHKIFYLFFLENGRNGDFCDGLMITIVYGFEPC